MSSLIQNTDDISHTAVITYLLKKISNLPGASDARVIACNELLTYVAKEALQFVLHHDKLRATVIDKCIQFKSEHSDNIHSTHYADLAATSTSLLAKLQPPPTVSTVSGCTCGYSGYPCCPCPKSNLPQWPNWQHPRWTPPTPRRSSRIAKKQRVVYTS